MAMDWNNQAEVLKRRQQAIQAGYKPADVDAFILKKREEAATISNLQQGVGDINKVSPIVAQKALQQGVKPKSVAQRAVETEKAKQSEKLSDVEKSINLLEQNLKQAELKGPESRPLAFINSLTGGSFFPETADYNSLRKSLIGPLARTISGEVGVLTDKDIGRAEGLLPKLTDSAKVRENKLNNLRQLLAEKQDKKFQPTTEKAQRTGQQPLTAQSVQQQPNNVLQQILPSLIPGVAGFNNPFQPSALQKFINPNISRAAEQVGQGQLPGKEQLPGLGFDLITSLLGGGTLKVAPKLVRPFKTVGEMRAAAISQAQGKTVSGNKIIEGLEKAVKTLSPADQKSYLSFLDTAKDVYKGVNLTVDDVLKINHEANKAYTAAGVAGKSAKAAFNETLGKILKKELSLNAPEVAKANKLFSLLYGSKNVAKRVANPITIGAGAAGALGSGVIGKMLFGR